MITKTNPIPLLIRQLENNFFLDAGEAALLESGEQDILDELENCFNFIQIKYFRVGDDSFFNPYHSGQWCIFLTKLSAKMSRDGHRDLADKIYYLNKILHSVDIYHEVQMPQVFFVEHPLSSVIGRAEIGDKFAFYQGCTVGGNNTDYPTIGKNVCMFSDSKILGKSLVGDNVWVSANTYIKDQDVPDNCIVFGRSPELTIKHRPADFFYSGGIFSKDNVS